MEHWLKNAIVNLYEKNFFYITNFIDSANWLAITAHIYAKE